MSKEKFWFKCSPGRVYGIQELILLWHSQMWISTLCLQITWVYLFSKDSLNLKKIAEESKQCLGEGVEEYVQIKLKVWTNQIKGMYKPKQLNNYLLIPLPDFFPTNSVKVAAISNTYININNIFLNICIIYVYLFCYCFLLLEANPWGSSVAFIQSEIQSGWLQHIATSTAAVG